MEIIPALIPKTPNSTIANQFIDSPSRYKTNSAWQSTVGESLLVNQLWHRDGKPHNGVGQPLSHYHLKAERFSITPFLSDFLFRVIFKNLETTKQGKV